MTEPVDWPQRITEYAMTGKLAGVQAKWGHATRQEQSDAFLFGCDQSNETIPLWILAQMPAGQIGISAFRCGLTHAASRGHLATLRLAWDQLRWPKGTLSTVVMGAVLNHQDACLAFLVPLASPRQVAEVLDIMRNNYDDGYGLTYEEGIMKLDAAGVYLPALDRQRWLSSVGEGLLPRTAAVERASCRQDHLQRQPSLIPGRRRRRS